MSCGCKTSGDASHSCGTKSATGCSSVDTCNNSYKLSVFDWLAGTKNPINESNYVEVRFKNDRKSYFINNNLPLHMGATIAVETTSGFDVGVVSLTGELVNIQMKKKFFDPKEAQKIYRLATQKDVEVWQEARLKENGIKVEARKIVQRLKLDMKISDIEYQGDATKITFYYIADGRVDFRQLIKEFAQTFRVKIDMKQIGFRQESAKVGGIGSCGRELCCSTWLTDFRSVNTSAARYQQLSINPQKLAGQCGKLKCCLNFELDSYVDALSHFPSSNTSLDTEKGRAYCIKIDVFKAKMWFAYHDSPMAWFDLDIKDVKSIIAQNKRGEKGPELESFKDLPEIEKTTVNHEGKLDRFDRKPRKNNNTRSRKPAENTGPKKVVKAGEVAENKAEEAKTAAVEGPKPEKSNQNRRKPKPKNQQKQGPKPQNADNKGPKPEAKTQDQKPKEAQAQAQPNDGPAQPAANKKKRFVKKDKPNNPPQSSGE
jgi:cell fate regulator YaaT (PSP1 superfamily)